MTDGISLRDLSIRHGALELVRDVTLELAGGQVLALVGSSGCGKTLTARALVGLVDARPGVVRADLEIRSGGVTSRPWDDVLKRGWSVPRAFAPVRGDVLVYLPQDARAALDPLQRIGGQVASAARLAGDTSDPVTWLERVGLQEPGRVARCYPHEISGGMAQRVVIAQALARRSRFLLADEPTTGLDPTVGAGILAQLRAVADSGVGVLLITHDLRVLPGLADQVVLMQAGATLEALSADDLLRGGATTALGRQLIDATRLIAAGRLG